jgi:signal transduction histidine kinase
LRLWTRPALAVEDRLFRALGILRVILLLNAIALNIYRFDNFDHPVAGIVVLAGMTGWTAFTVWAYADPARRTAVLLSADLAVALAAILVSSIVKGPDMNATIPGFWVIGALMAWAIQWRWQGGLIAGIVLCAADLGVRDEISQANYGNVFLLVIGGLVVGFLSESLRLMEVERDDALRASVADAERARLARAVHDGVLQVLALVQRRGAELGGDAADLGRLAGEQEAALRTLIRRQDAVEVPPGSGPAPDADLTSALTRLEATRRVTVAAPARPVLLPAGVVDELVSVVAACLDNVAVHVGPEAPAWVLLEELPDRLSLSVRDEGPGIPEGRLDQAAREGRLGVSESIRGRVADLGGTADLVTGSFGTEWEFTVPRAGHQAGPEAGRTVGG